MQTMTKVVVVRAVGVIMLSKAFASSIHIDAFVNNDWLFFIMTRIFWSVVAAAGVGVVMLRSWSRNLGVTVLTVYAITLLCFAAFVGVLMPREIRQYQVISTEWIALLTDPVYLLSQASRFGIIIMAALVLRMVLRDERLDEVFGES